MPHCGGRRSADLILQIRGTMRESVNEALHPAEKLQRDAIGVKTLVNESGAL
jgi:hypothetical protein